MKSRFFIVAFIALIYSAMLLAAPRATTVAAHPPAQATRAPTEEPTKRPYVFPTPVFIPPYADETPVTRNTPAAPLQPGVETYTVESGDSPWLIAQKVYGDGTKYKLIMEANGLADQTRLRVGTVLKIPSMGGTPAQPLAPTASPSEPQIPTLNPAEPALTATPVPTVSAIPTLLPTPTAPSTPNPLVDALPTLVTAASAIMFIGALVVGLSAYGMYLRQRKIEQLSSGKQQIRLKH